MNEVVTLLVDHTNPMCWSLNPMIGCSCLACLRINGVEQPHNQIFHATIELSDRAQLVHDNLFAFFGSYHVLTINRLWRFNLHLGSSAGDTGIRNNGLGGRGLRR